MVSKHKQMKKKNFRNHGRNNKKLTAVIKKKLKKSIKNKKRRKTEKEHLLFQDMKISDNERKKSVSSLAESVESGEISSSSSEWKTGSDK